MTIQSQPTMYPSLFHTQNKPALMAPASIMERIANGIEQNRILTNGVAPQSKSNRTKVMTSEEGLAVIDNATDALVDTENILGQINSLTEKSLDDTTDDDMRKKLQTKMDGLLTELDRISDTKGAGLLDGSFGGTTGRDGLSKMGISSISSDGTAVGAAKFHITQRDDAYEISLRINGETITNRVDQNATGTAFRLSNGREISVSFLEGAKIQEGTVANVQFMRGMKDANTLFARSADIQDKNAVIATSSKKTIRLPDLKDVSAFGLGLYQADIRTIVSAQRMEKELTGAVKNVQKLHRDLNQTKDSILRAEGIDPQKAETVPVVLNVQSYGAVPDPIKRLPAYALIAQTTFLHRQDSIAILLK